MLNYSSMQKYPRGRRGSPAKGVGCLKTPRGFKSLLLRQETDLHHGGGPFPLGGKGFDPERSEGIAALRRRGRMQQSRNFRSRAALRAETLRRGSQTANAARWIKPLLLRHENSSLSERMGCCFSFRSVRNDKRKLYMRLHEPGKNNQLPCFNTCFCMGII